MSYSSSILKVLQGLCFVLSEKGDTYMAHHHPTPSRMTYFSPHSSWQFYSGGGGGMGLGVGERGPPPNPLGKTPGIPGKGSLSAPWSPVWTEASLRAQEADSLGAMRLHLTHLLQFLLWSVSTRTGRLSSFYLI